MSIMKNASSNAGEVGFFQEVYQNYNQIWQSVLKLNLINNTLVNSKSFEKILIKCGLNVENPYCKFLLQTSIKQYDSQNDPQTNNSVINQANPSKQQNLPLIDYKQFLNQSIKALSQEPFENETFIIEQFWKIKFGESHHRHITIQEFNKGFYEFFNKDSKMISIDSVDQIVNECFQYALRKNKKFISKRSFRKVVKRNFRDIFSLILVDKTQNKQQKPQDPLTQQSEQLADQIGGSIPKDDTLGGNVQSTYYPDSLDTRSQKQSRPAIICSNPSKSFQETSTFYNLSNNTRSKSSEGFSNNYQSTSFQHSSYDALAQQISYLTEKRQEIKRNALQTLQLALERAMDKMGARRVFHKLRINSVAQARKAFLIQRSRMMEKIIDKENIIPYNDSKSRKHELFISKDASAFNTTHGSRTQHFQERGTFSFNNLSKDKRKQRMMEHQTFISPNNFNTELYQDKNFLSENEDELNFLQNIPQKEHTVSAFENQNNHQQSHHHKIQSYGSLQYSNTPTMSQRPVFHVQQFKYDQIPVSTKSNSISARNYTCTTSQSNEYRLLSQRQHESQFYLSQNNHNSRSHHDLYTDINKYDSNANMIMSHPTDDSTMKDLEQKLKDIRSGNTTTKNINKKNTTNNQRSNGQLSGQGKVNQFKHIVRNSYQNRRSAKSSMQISDSNAAYPSMVVKNLDQLALGPQQQSSEYSQIHHTHKNSRVTNFEQLTTDQNSIITDITPIPNKNNSSHNFREDHSSLSRLIDQHPQQSIITTNIQRSQDGRVPSHKSKEALHFERKYKKSKDKFKALISENILEKAKNQNLEQQNSNLGQKVELLEKRFEQMQTELSKNLDNSNSIQLLLKQSQQKQAISILLFMNKMEVQSKMRYYMHQWRNQCIKTNCQAFKLSQYMKQAEFKDKSNYFGAWVRYTLTRKTRKEKRKIQKLQVKSLRIAMKRLMLIQQKRIFNFWKGPFLKNMMLDDFQRDMQFAHEQVKSMRNIVCFNKIDHMLEKREINLKSFAFSRMVLNDFSKRSFNAETSEFLTQSKSFSATKKNKVASPLIQNCQLNNRLQIQQQQQFYQQPVQQHFQYISQYEDERQFQMNIPNTDYSQKMLMQRRQQKVLEGIEMIYNVLKRQSQYIKDDYFSIWKHYTYNCNQQEQIQQQQLEQQNYYEQMQYQQMNFYHPEQIFNNASGDLDTSQEVPLNLAINPVRQNQYADNGQINSNSGQPPQLQQPCYYKTNEGYFYPNQQELLSPNKYNGQKRLNFIEYSSKNSSMQQIPYEYQSNYQSSVQSLSPINVIPRPYPLTHAPTQQSQIIASNSSSQRKIMSQKTRSQIIKPPSAQEMNQMQNLNDVSTLSRGSNGANNSNYNGDQSSTNKEELFQAIAYLKAKVNVGL